MKIIQKELIELFSCIKPGDPFESEGAIFIKMQQIIKQTGVTYNVFNPTFGHVSHIPESAYVRPRPDLIICSKDLLKEEKEEE